MHCFFTVSKQNDLPMRIDTDGATSAQNEDEESRNVGLCSTHGVPSLLWIECPVVEGSDLLGVLGSERRFNGTEAEALDVLDERILFHGRSMPF